MSTGVELSEDALRKRLHEGVSKFASRKEAGTKERGEFSRLCLILSTVIASIMGHIPNLPMPLSGGFNSLSMWARHALNMRAGYGRSALPLLRGYA